MKLEEFRRSVSDIDDDLIADAYACEEQIKRKRTRGRRILLLVSLLALIAAALSLSLFFALRTGEEAPDPEPTAPSAEPTPAATVYIEGEIGVSFVVSEDRTVLRVEALDELALSLLDGDKCVGLPLEEAVGMFAASMIDNNYLTTEDNALLLTVDAPEEIAEPLSDEVEKTIRAVANESSPGSSALVLVKNPANINSTDQIKELTETYGISERMASLLIRIVEADDSYTYEELAKKSVRKLGHICKTLNLNIARLSKEATIELVLAHAGVDRDGAELLQISDNNAESFNYYWLIDFYCENHAYRYAVDKYTGLVLQTAMTDCMSTEEIIGIMTEYLRSKGEELVECKVTYNREEYARVRIQTSDGKTSNYKIDAKTFKVTYTL